jgi:hypothetical protein
MADLTQNHALVNASNLAVIRKEYPAGASVAGGNLVYLNPSNRWAPFDANVGAGAGANINDLRGIALHNAADNQPLAVATSDPNFGIGATVANGVPYYGSNNAGGVTADVPASGAYTVFIGFGISTSRINLQPVAAGVAV